ncbi:MAG: hypothetical protein WBF53_15900 [Litorimonas sp.]
MDNPYLIIGLLAVAIVLALIIGRRSSGERQPTVFDDARESVELARRSVKLTEDAHEMVRESLRQQEAMIAELREIKHLLKDKGK